MDKLSAVDQQSCREEMKRSMWSSRGLERSAHPEHRRDCSSNAAIAVIRGNGNCRVRHVAMDEALMYLSVVTKRSAAMSRSEN